MASGILVVRYIFARDGHDILGIYEREPIRILFYKTLGTSMGMAVLNLISSNIAQKICF